MSLKKVLVPTLVLFIIVTLVTAALALTQNITADTIIATKEKQETELRQSVFTTAGSFKEVEIPANNDDVKSIYAALDKNNQNVGYTINSTSSGYGGLIEIMVAIDNQGVISNIKIVDYNETPGLGTNASKDEFTNQYYIKRSEDFTVVKSNKSADNQILALSGATITSKAVTKAVNAAYNCYLALGGVS